MGSVLLEKRRTRFDKLTIRMMMVGGQLSFPDFPFLCVRKFYGNPGPTRFP